MENCLHQSFQGHGKDIFLWEKNDAEEEVEEEEERRMKRRRQDANTMLRLKKKNTPPQTEIKAEKKSSETEL